MIQLIDYTQNNEEVTHFFIDNNNKNVRYAYSREEDMYLDIEANKSNDCESGDIRYIGKEWKLTNKWQVKGGETRKRKD